MTNKELNFILYSFKNAESKYQNLNYQLFAIRQKMQTIKTFDYTKDRVQGGEKSSTLEILIDRERSLTSKLSEQAKITDDLYASVSRLIYSISNKDRDCELLSYIYLQNLNYREVSKKLDYSYEYIKVKINRAKHRLLNFCNENNLKVENFI